jgi:NADH-quinone oxidoreductase subunit A
MDVALYLPILIFASVAGGLVLGLLALSRFRAKRYDNKEKNSPYECGFDPLEYTVPPLNVRFYLVGLLFLLFDVEIVFLFPWAVTLGKTGQFGFFSMAVFLAILTVGFVYEWMKGALDWT